MSVQFIDEQHLELTEKKNKSELVFCLKQILMTLVWYFMINSFKTVSYQKNILPSRKHEHVTGDSEARSCDINIHFFKEYIPSFFFYYYISNLSF